MLRLEKVELTRLLDNARKTALDHSIESERKVYLEIINNLEHIW